MHKIIWYVGILSVACGLVMNERFREIRFIIIAIGICVILGCLTYDMTNKKAVICPKCRSKYSWKVPIAYRQKNGIFRCPYCGTLIRVSESK